MNVNAAALLESSLFVAGPNFQKVHAQSPFITELILYTGALALMMELAREDFFTAEQAEALSPLIHELSKGPQHG